MSLGYFAYYRKSTDEEDRQVLSLDGQSEVVRDFALRHKMLLTCEFRESFSAKKAGRPLFGEIIQRLKKGEAKGILAYKADRLTRNYTDLGVLMELIETDIEVWDTTFGHYKNDSNGKLMFGFNAVMAKKKVDDLSEDVKRSVKQKCALGQFPGYAPTGYVNELKFHTIQPDELRAPYVKRAFELFSSGGYSVKSLAQKLACEGFTSRLGNEMKTSTLHGILRNPFYYKYFRCNGGLHNGNFQALITKELFDSVQHILNSRKPVWQNFVDPISEKKRSFQYKGVLSCAVCGCSITASFHEKKQKNGNKHTYTHYHCTKSKGNCRQKTISEDKLEEQLSHIFRNIVLSEENAWSVKVKLNELYQDDIRYQNSIETNLVTRLQKLRDTKEALFLKMVNDAFEDDIAVFKTLKEKLDVEISQIEKQLGNMKEHSGTWYEQASNLIELCRNADSLFKKGTTEQKKTLLNCIASNLVLKDGNVGFTYKKPFDALVNVTTNTNWLPLMDTFITGDFVILEPIPVFCEVSTSL
jgi:site-specific DNA recombinase